MRVRLTQLDGKLPNLALMKLGHWHRSQGHEVVFTRRAGRDLLEGEFDQVYGSAIFAFSEPKLEHFRREWPDALVGGTGTGAAWTVEDVIGVTEYEHYDYSAYPQFEASIGFTQRGCRMTCGFCVVPKKEGRNRGVNTIADIWRGEGHPRKLHLLDNDFGGQPEWEKRIQEINDGGFKVCWNQGLNQRLIFPALAQALATVQYRDDSFRERRLYTAWDNLKDERIYFRGLGYLEDAGIPAKHIMSYMLVGFDPTETWERIFYRFDKMVAAGVLPYPMVYDTRGQGSAGVERYRGLKRFQRWVLTGLYRAVPWADYDPHIRALRRRQKAAAPEPSLFDAVA